MSQPLTILFLSATRDKSLAPPTAAKSCGQGQVHCAKCLEAGNLRNRALFWTLPVLGAVTPAAALGLGVAVTAAFSLMLLPVSVNYQVPATTAAGSAPGA